MTTLRELIELADEWRAMHGVDITDYGLTYWIGGEFEDDQRMDVALGRVDVGLRELVIWLPVAPDAGALRMDDVIPGRYARR